MKNFQQLTVDLEVSEISVHLQIDGTLSMVLNLIQVFFVRFDKRNRVVFIDQYRRVSLASKEGYPVSVGGGRLCTHLSGG
jgi:hypothetical protein